jgi:GrpB-like predicted nucleotidyltransferase (UPF0157 family)
MFTREKNRLMNVIAPWVMEIEHVGSTAVPGLAAKPTIDIMAGIRTLDEAPLMIPRLEKIGYIYHEKYQESIPERCYLYRMNGSGHTHHLHIVEMNSEFWCSHLLFRDYLRDHPDVASDYAELKIRLLDEFYDDLEGYTYAKTDFITSVLNLATSRVPAA